MTEADTSFVGKVQREIAERGRTDQQEARTSVEKTTKGKELYNAMRDIAITYGEAQTISVGAGSRQEGVMGHRLDQTTRLVAPVVEINTKEGVVSMQVLEIQPMHVDENRHQPLGYTIIMDNTRLTIAKPLGDITNWHGERASLEEINLIKDEVIPAIEEAYAEKFPERAELRNPTDVRISELDDEETAVGSDEALAKIARKPSGRPPKRKPREGYPRMRPRENGIIRDESATVQPD